MMFSSLSVLMFLPCIVLIDADTCPYGFLRHGRSCYWFSTIKGTFPEASAICQFLDSKLASITSEDENAYIRGYTLRHGRGRLYWLGGTDLRHLGTWTWEKPTRAFGFSMWEEGEPNNRNGGGILEHCLAIYSHPDYPRWNDRPCSDRAFFVCQTVDENATLE